MVGLLIYSEITCSAKYLPPTSSETYKISYDYTKSETLNLDLLFFFFKEYK